MKCPKCGYIGIDSAERCRNCGYDLARVAALKRAVTRELPFNAERAAAAPSEAGGAPIDPAAEPAAGSRGPASGRAASGETDDFNLGIATPPPGIPKTASPEPRFLALDLDAEPVASSKPAAPRRIKTVDRGAARNPAADIKLVSPDVGPPLDFEIVAPPPLAMRSPQGIVPAGIGRRVAAGLLDLLVLGTVGAITIYLTARLCDLPWRDALNLPLAPLAVMLGLVAFGYGLLFTGAGGQTIGKMAAGLRVTTESGHAVDFTQAAIRTAASGVSAVILGAGFLMALFDRSRRTLHDRIANTIVVRVF